MNLSDSSWTDADASDVDVVAVPVGSTEQHGPHAPLGTDVLLAEAVAEAGVAAAEASVLVGPTIPVGVAEEHRQFTGTCWVSPNTFRAYVREVLESLASHGWDRIVVVNGHGGNVPALREVCGAVTRSEVAMAVPFTWFDAIDPQAVAADVIGNGEDRDIEMGHGGAAETSVLRAVRPDLVHEDRLGEAADGAAASWGEWAGGSNLAYDTAEFSDNGVMGDPSASDPAVGEALLEASGERFASLVAALIERDVARPDHR